MNKNDYSKMYQSEMPETVDECKKLFKLTRDFDLYLDMLNRLKSKYLIVLCLKTATGQNISVQTAEKIRKLGFTSFTIEPDMRYVGVFYDGRIIFDSAADVYEAPAFFDGGDSKVELHVSFDGKEGEIKINGKNQSLNDNGINIVVYDPAKQETVDVCCYNAAEGNPTFYHRNFYYTVKYIDTHIYIPESFKEKVTLPLRRSYFSPRRLNVREVERGIFLPAIVARDVGEKSKDKNSYRTLGGICDENFNFIAGHQLLNPRYMYLDDKHIADSYTVPPENITYIDETVLYGGSLMEHPGHLIVECFADRLWWLAENADSNIKIAVEILLRNSVWTEGRISFVREFLDLFGISKDRLIFIEKPTQFKKIIVPDQSAIPYQYCFPYEFTSEYIKPFQHIKERLTPGKYKKIYFTKSKTLKKNIIGEDYFIDFFEKKGFQIIHPEDYNMKEKAEMMYGADEVVTVDGTSSLFTVFCKPTARLTVLTRRINFWDIAQQLVTEALGIKDFFLVNVSGNFLDGFSGDEFISYALGMTFVYATKEFKSYVKYIYNEDIDITPEESMKKYFYDYLTYFPEFYSIPGNFQAVRQIKMPDILRSMSEVFLGKKLDTSGLDFSTVEESRIKELEHQLYVSNKKSKNLTEKAKEFIEENANLKRTLAQRESEIEQLRSSNAEMASYVAEINRLLDSLEAGDDSQSE